MFGWHAPAPSQVSAWSHSESAVSPHAVFAGAMFSTHLPAWQESAWSHALSEEFPQAVPSDLPAHSFVSVGEPSSPQPTNIAIKRTTARAATR